MLAAVIRAHEAVFVDGLGQMSAKDHLTLKPGARPVYKYEAETRTAAAPQAERDHRDDLPAGLTSRLEHSAARLAGVTAEMSAQRDAKSEL